jgi:hypothetical protein
MPHLFDADSMLMAPPWVPAGLAFAFLMGAVFYLFRLCNPAYLTRVNGYCDGENEFWHGVCLVAMVTALCPAMAPVPTAIWCYVLPSGSVWYLLRAATWGRKKPHNKLWYDIAHAAMFFGMWWMYFHPVSDPRITAAFLAYWTWFGSYYIVRLLGDLRHGHWLSTMQDVFHLGMASVMVVMTLAPMYLMPM